MHIWDTQIEFPPLKAMSGDGLGCQAEEVLSGIRWVVVSDIAKRPAKPRTATFSCSRKEISGPTAKREKWESGLKWMEV